MIRILSSALLLLGLAMPGFSGSQPQPQPEPQAQVKHGQMYVLSSGDRSYLGVDIQDITSDRVAPLKLKEERGVEITMVDQDAPAGKAGLKEHDVILEFNGTKVESEEQLRRLIRETPPGRTITLGISRDGGPMQVPVQLADRAKLVQGVRVPRITIPDIEIPRIEIPSYSFQMQTYSPSLGIQTESLTRQLGEFFGVKDGEGILVRSVEKGSAAEKAGLKAGDVIVRADNQKLSGRAELSQVLRSHRQGGKLSLTIVRDKREQNVMLDLPERRKDSSWNFDFDSDDEAQWAVEDARDLVENLRPEVNQATASAMVELNSAMEGLRAQFGDSWQKQSKEINSQIQKAMREGRNALRESQRQMREQQKQFKNLGIEFKHMQMI